MGVSQAKADFVEIDRAATRAARKAFRFRGHPAVSQQFPGKSGFETGTDFVK
jgi:hypothetical protein